MGNGGNSEVPQEIMAVLPSDPYEQLDLARRITAMAVAERLSKLETENGKLKGKLAEKDLFIAELQDRVMDAESSLQETTSRLSATLDDHSKLTNEKNLLLSTVKKLNRDVVKLETFKRTLMQSLQDDGDDGSHKSPAGGGYSGGGGHASSFSSSVLMASNAANAAAASETKKSPHSNASPESRLSSSRSSSVVAEQTDHNEPPFSLDSSTNNGANDVKHVQEIDHPPGPKQQSKHVSPPQPSPVAPPPVTAEQPSRWQQQSSAGSPERPTPTPYAERPPPPTESKLTIPLSLPSSRSTTAPNSPPNANSTNAPGRTPRVDGKEFFRQARNRLSYEQFSSFLANIKELNAHRQTREETLRKADKTFGPENKDLYSAFDGLLSRHLSS